MKTLRPNFIVGIGGSAGGLVAYVALLDKLPSDSGMAFIFIAHLLPSANSQLVQILSRHTLMKVKLAVEGMPIQMNYIYVIPPNADLLIENYTLKVVSPRRQRNNQVDLFFTSLAKAMGANAIGIILSGYDGDGSEGCKQIKARGGTTFAQDTSAEVKHMPSSAKATGCVDFVLPPIKISEELQRLVRNSTLVKKIKRPSP
jgi:two-component system CheB/CheR fusion protein